MLDAIFSSVARVKILNLFLLSSEKKYLPIQLARDFNISLAIIRHELDNLVKFGLLNEEVEPDSAKIKRKNLKKIEKLYSVNTNFLLYSEIKAVFVKAQILFSQKFIIGLKKISQPSFIALTGLFTNYPEAQTDILIVGTIRRSAFLKLLKDLENDLGREINYTIMSEREFIYRRELMDIFLYNILEGRTLVLLDNLQKIK